MLGKLSVPVPYGGEDSTQSSRSAGCAARAGALRASSPELSLRAHADSGFGGRTPRTPRPGAGCLRGAGHYGAAGGRHAPTQRLPQQRGRDLSTPRGCGERRPSPDTWGKKAAASAGPEHGAQRPSSGGPRSLPPRRRHAQGPPWGPRAPLPTRESAAATRGRRPLPPSVQPGQDFSTARCEEAPASRPHAPAARRRGRAGGGRRQGRPRRDGAGLGGHVPEVRAWLMAVPWPSAALGRSSMMAPRPGRRALGVLSGSTSPSEPRALAPRRPGAGAWRRPTTTSGMDLSRCGGRSHPRTPRQRGRQPGPAAVSVRLGTNAHKTKVPRRLRSAAKRSLLHHQGLYP